MTEIVRAGLRYRSTKTPITREEIEQLNRDIATVGFKIPELWDAKFLNNFPRATSPAQTSKEPETQTATFNR